MGDVMKNLVILMFMVWSLSLLTSCGKKTETINGNPGQDGQSCHSETRSDGNYVVCGDSEFKVEDGKDGTNGQDGVDGADGEDGSFDGYFELVELCPEKSGSHKETLMYLDGQYLAFLSNPNYKKQRLVILQENTQFKTTDGRNIYFTINNGQIIYTTNGCSNFDPEA